MSELVAFLLARIEDDEQAARAVPPIEPWDSQRYGLRFLSWESDHSESDTAFVDRFDPARVLAECDAKREIVDLHQPLDERPECPACVQFRDWQETEMERDPCPTLRLLALPFAGHPDYREEWAVE